jgi:methionine-rich copper-binding protein CopC
MKIVNIFAVAFCLWVFSSTSLAHTAIKISNIENGAILAFSPAAFEFSFSANVGLAALELQMQGDNPVSLEYDSPTTMRKEFSAPLPELRPGAYIIRWRAVANDGHVMRGEISFVITN